MTTIPGRDYPNHFPTGPLSRKSLTVADNASAPGPNYRFGGMITYEKPITEFFPDILIPVNAAGSVTTLRAGQELPGNCVGLRFISLVAGVLVSVNGLGLRTVMNNDTFSGCEINQIQIVTDATGTCILQAVGTGD